MDKKRRVLVVDDEPGIGRMLRIKFGISGFDVNTTTSGAKAIELVRAHEPDILLIDIHMPDVTGMDVIQRIRSFSQVPIIVFTGHPDIARFATEFGVNDYIPKPFNPDFLIQKVEAVFTAAQNSKEHLNI